MERKKTRWAAVLTAAILLFAFGLTACDGEVEEGLGSLRDIYIVTADLKTTYTVGDEFDYSAVKIRAVYERGDESLTAADADKGVTHTELDMEKAGTQTLTVTYKEKSASVGITVREEEKAVLKGLQFSGGTTAYTVGDKIDYAQFKLTAIYSVGEDVALTGDSKGVTHTTVSTEEAGTKKLTFTYTDNGVTKEVSVDIIVSEAEAPVILISIEVKSAAADRTVAFGGTVDYSKFTIVQHFSDGTSDSTLNGASEGVTRNKNIDTSLSGEQELTFTYQGKTSAPVTITVLAQKVTLSRFALPKFYADVAAVKGDKQGTASEDRDSFMKGFETYKVGDDNAFEFQPVGTVLLSTTELRSVTVRTTFTLEEKGTDGNFTPVAEDQVETYVKTEPLLPNYYYFTENAVGEVFKLKIRPDAESYTVDGNDTIEAVIEVVDGYNVYNQIGLSVFDNLNVKHWAAVKEAAGTLRWDSKPLADYNIIKTGDEKFAPVKNIVLHGNITIDPDELPDSYFWQKTDAEYGSIESQLKENAKIPDSVKNYLEGSLKDGLGVNSWYYFDKESSGDLNEDAKTSVNMQKGVYVSTGTGIQGNFHEITYHTSGIKHSLYTVYDGKDHDTDFGSAFPLSHWSLFKYGNETTQGVEIVNEGKPVVSDLRILGQSPRLAATEGEPAHLMAFNSCTNEVNLENCIVSRLFVVVLGDEASSNVKISDCKMFDIYSNMFYLWRAQIDVKTSIMEDAGGPIFILCDGNRKASDGTAGEPKLTVDRESRFKSEAGGTESWYALNNASALFAQIKNIDTLAKAKLGITLCSSTVGENELVNVIAIIVPEPSEIMKPAKDADSVIKTRGSIVRGDTGKEYFYGGYTPNMIAKVLMDKFCPILSSGRVFNNATEAGMDINSQTVYGVNPSNIKMSDYSADPDVDLKPGWKEAVATSDWFMLNFNAGPLYQSQLCPWFAILLGGVRALEA